MDQDMGNDQVKLTVFIIHVLGILLREMDWFLERFCARMCVPQNRGGNVDGVNFRIGERIDVGDCAVTYRTAQIENTFRPEIRFILLQVGNRRSPDVVVERTHASHGIKEDCPIIDGAGSNIIRSDLCVVAAWLTMNIDSPMIGGYFQIRVEFQGGKIEPCGLGQLNQLRQLPLHRQLAGFPHQLLA